MIALVLGLLPWSDGAGLRTLFTGDGYDPGAGYNPELQTLFTGAAAGNGPMMSTEEPGMFRRADWTSSGNGPVGKQPAASMVLFGPDVALCTTLSGMAKFVQFMYGTWLSGKFIGTMQPWPCEDSEDLREED